MPGTGLDPPTTSELARSLDRWAGEIKEDIRDLRDEVRGLPSRAEMDALRGQVLELKVAAAQRARDRVVYYTAFLASAVNIVLVIYQTRGA
jgi:hypothetical protein